MKSKNYIIIGIYLLLSISVSCQKKNKDLISKNVQLDSKESIANFVCNKKWQIIKKEVQRTKDNIETTDINDREYKYKYFDCNKNEILDCKTNTCKDSMIFDARFKINEIGEFEVLVPRVKITINKINENTICIVYQDKEEIMYGNVYSKTLCYYELIK